MTGRKWFFWIMKHLWNRLKIQLEISAPSTLWPVWRFSVTFLDFLANINFSSFHRGACLVYCCVAGGPPHILIVVISTIADTPSKKPKHKKTIPTYNYTDSVLHSQEKVSWICRLKRGGKHAWSAWFFDKPRSTLNLCVVGL